ncbi:MAG: hypothetical protein JST00_10690 [Deltaproteobacteria bacterium]|nr:hypothetical protein [Deltaproteobacteria bacterium]
MNAGARPHAATSTFAALALPLDAARSAVLRLVGRPGRGFLADRAARVGLYATIGIVVALALACVAPLWAFALGPILLGVPHLVADVRYLVVRPGLHRRRSLVIAVGLPIVVATLVQSPAIGLASGAGAVVFATSDRIELSPRRVALLVALAAAVVVAAMAPRATSLALLHGHNVLAVVLFLVAFARSRRVGAYVAVASVVASAALLGGAFDSVILSAVDHGAGPRTGLSFEGMLDVLAPNVADPVTAMRVAIFFVFAQGVHYAVWLRMVPEEARERPGIRSFGSSIAALERELGAWVVGGVALLAVALLARAGGSLEAARLLYLRGSGFHGYLEIAFLLYWLSTPRSRAQECPSVS